MPGTLIIAEATLVSSRTACAKYMPGIWTQAQIEGWKSITDAVHAKGCKIFCQIIHRGRAGNPEILARSGFQVQSSSALPIGPGYATPVAMTEERIAEAIRDFVAAAQNSIAAGFDGVEIHGANGYLIDQFLQDTCNKRTDRWGGSIENRSRLLIEITMAVIAAVGADKTATRLTPYSDFQAMLMDDPDPTFSYLLDQLKPMNLAYLHLVEARISGNDDADCGGQRTVRWMVEQWGNATPVLIAGGFTAQSARTAVDETYKDYDVSIVFGRYFVSNPDLVFRVKTGLALNKYDRSSFYTQDAKGYTDYPFSQQFLSAPVLS